MQKYIELLKQTNWCLCSIKCIIQFISEIPYYNRLPYILLNMADCIVMRQWMQWEVELQEKVKEKATLLPASMVTVTISLSREIISLGQVFVVLGGPKTNQPCYTRA